MFTHGCLLEWMCWNNIVYNKLFYIVQAVQILQAIIQGISIVHDHVHANSVCLLCLPALGSWGMRVYVFWYFDKSASK